MIISILKLDSFYKRLTIKISNQVRNISKIISGFLNQEKLKPENSRLVTITIDLTSKCNLSCAHCNAKNSSNPDRDQFDYQHLKKNIKIAQKLGCRYINVLGGEPFLVPDKLFQIADDFPTMPMQVFTNGTLLTPRILKKLENYSNLFVTVSIEGTKEYNDKMRGEGSFDKAMKALELLKNSKLLYGVSVTANKTNYMNLSSPEFAELINKFECFYVWIFDFKPFGQGATQNELCLNQADRDLFNQRITELNKKHKFIFVNSENYNSPINMCVASKGQIIHINAFGDITPCPAVHDVHSENNIKFTTIDKVLDSRIFQEYRAIGDLKGCAKALEPEKYKEWVKRNELVEIFY